MSLVMLALLVAFGAATTLVLADSGLRLWSAVGGLRAQRAAMTSGQAAAARPSMRPVRMTTRVSYARSVSAQAAPLRVAA